VVQAWLIGRDDNPSWGPNDDLRQLGRVGLVELCIGRFSARARL